MNPAQVFYSVTGCVAPAYWQASSSTVGIFLKKINNKNKQIAVRFLIIAYRVSL